ncbi:MAG: LysM peptidoglycan-binding domain-containing protein [Pseudomonadota bacterium]|nr:LysM peptidoglycan-binding domain-containing protein [Pseudomonadota bacterium]
MTSVKMCSGGSRLLKPAALLLLSMLVIVGCAPLTRHSVPVAVQPNASGAQRAPVAAARENSLSLAAIVNDQIQHGRYAEGEASLRRYLMEHPGEGSAKAMLHQLTVDPRQMLGAGAGDYTVKPGDSYSSLAAHYLGDASLFVVLARYNGSGNPSDLRVGQTLKLPLSARGVDEAVASPMADTAPVREATPLQVQVAALADASPEAKAGQLQEESVTLFKQGKKQAALKHLDQALLIQPTLKSSGAVATSLREQLVAKYHEQAVVLYRDQKLDPAIALWDRVLAIEPGFEPAVIYRTRALELKRRLKQF